MALMEYKVWDRTTRLFHWINVLCIIGLSVFGLIIVNADSLGVGGPAEIPFKRVHVWIGYVFAINLTWRLVWAFIGGPFARWSAILPFGSGYGAQLKAYVAGLKSGHAPAYLGHNPLARLSVSLLFLLLVVQGATGLILAGTDLFMPPFGNYFAEWVAAPGVDPAAVVPGVPELVDAAKRAEMRAFRSPIVTTHFYNFFVLAALIVLHIYAAVYTDVKEKGAIISAMFTGRKIHDQPPVDG